MYTLVIDDYQDLSQTLIRLRVLWATFIRHPLRISLVEQFVGSVADAAIARRGARGLFYTRNRGRLKVTRRAQHTADHANVARAMMGPFVIHQLVHASYIVAVRRHDLLSYFPQISSLPENRNML